MSGFSINILGFPGGSDGKESACNAGDLGLIPVSPLEKEMAKKKKKRKWQLTPVFFFFN